MRASLERTFSIDLRSLAAFRVALGGALLADLVLRARDLVPLYTEQGVLPRAAFADHPIGWLIPWVSLHAHGPVAFQVFLFVLAALLALALAVGRRARLAALGSWLLLVSLQNRNPLVGYGGDIVLVLLLFWSLFLPLGACWSVDARRGRGAPGARSVFSWGSAGLLVQIAALHFFSALHKRGPEWIPDGSAIFYALHVDKFVRPLGEGLRSHDLLMRALTYGSFSLELAGPLLLFCPWKFPALRLLAIAGFVGFHAGIGATLDLVLFSWVSALGMTAFLPPGFWERAAWLVRRPGPGSREAAAGVAPPRRASRVTDRVAAAALAFVLFWNVATLREDWQAAVESDPVLQWVIFPGLLLRLGQTWFMFAPAPPKETRWHVVKGVLADGSPLDLLRGGDAPPSFEKPAARRDYYPSGRWERLFANAPESAYVDAWRSLARWYCTRWNTDLRHETRLERIAIFSRSEKTLPGGERELLAPRLVVRQRCSAAGSVGAVPEADRGARPEAGRSASRLAAPHSTSSHATRAW